MSDPIEPPAPPSRDALAAVLAQIVEGAPLLADRPVAEIAHGLQRLSMANGWRLEIEWRYDWWHPARVMGPLLAAVAPDGGRWEHGCDRWLDWNSGPDAVVLDPLQHLLTPEQRERLRIRLLDCSCWPAPDPPPVPPSMAWIDEHFPLEVMAS
jgi:hypothetical protein